MNNEKLIEYYFYFGLIVTILNVILSICLFSPNVVYSIHKKWFKWKANEVLYTKKEVNEILTNLRKRIIEAKGTDKYILTSGNEFFGVSQELLNKK